MIKDVLAGLGMTNNEVEIYITLLKSGLLSVNEIAEQSTLHRQVCYDALERLLEKGFVSYITERNKKCFQALPPGKILDYLDQKKAGVRDILPELEKMTTLPRDKTFVQVIRSRNVIRTVLSDVIKTLKEKGGMLMMLGVEEEQFIEEDRIAIKQYLRDMKAYRLKERLIAREGARMFFSGIQSEYKVIPAKYFNPNPLYIYGGKVVQMVWSTEPLAIFIENKDVYDSNRKHFEMLWSIARPLHRLA